MPRFLFRLVALFWLTAPLAQAATLASGTYEFAFTATLASEQFETAQHPECSGVYAASDNCLAGQPNAGRWTTFSSGQGFDALDTAGVNTPVAHLRDTIQTGVLTIEFDSSESGQWNDRYRSDSTIDCRIGAMSCGGTRYADFFFLLMETDAAGEQLLDIGFSSDSWVGELSAAAYSSFHDVSGIGGSEATAYRYNRDLTDFRMLSGPQMPSVPLPSPLACLTLALLAPAALRRRRA